MEMSASRQRINLKERIFPGINGYVLYSLSNNIGPQKVCNTHTIHHTQTLSVDHIFNATEQRNLSK